MRMGVRGTAEGLSVAARTGPINKGRPTVRGNVAKGSGPNVTGPFFNSQRDKFRQFWLISGVTRDSVGTALGSCTVHLFLTEGDLEVDETISDASTGAYTFKVGGNGQRFYTVGYKVGAPDVSGASVNTLTPVLT
jgi:hypothetical protein